MSGNEHCKEFVPGYPQLSGQIGLLPQYGIFRSFRAVSSRNILYLHAELIELEQMLHEAEKYDSECPDPVRMKYRRDWRWLKASEGSQCPEASRQCQIILQLRQVLKEYCKTDKEPIRLR
jgi:hypothetical protein